MEQWNKGNKMIRGIGTREDPYQWLDLMEERLRSMETLASTHISWYTHKNPYGCWICDMFLLTPKIIESFREFLGPADASVKGDESGSNESSESDVSNEEEED